MQPRPVEILADAILLAPQIKGVKNSAHVLAYFQRHGYDFTPGTGAIQVMAAALAAAPNHHNLATYVLDELERQGWRVKSTSASAAA